MIGVLVVITSIIASNFITQPASASKLNGRKIPCVHDYYNYYNYYNYCTQSYFGQARFDNKYGTGEYFSSLVCHVNPEICPHETGTIQDIQTAIRGRNQDR
jgi:hypothetical protein